MSAIDLTGDSDGTRGGGSPHAAAEPPHIRRLRERRSTVVTKLHTAQRNLDTFGAKLADKGAKLMATAAELQMVGRARECS